MKTIKNFFTKISDGIDILADFFDELLDMLLAIIDVLADD